MSYIIWVVVGAIVVIMAIIGYVAENKGKGKTEKVKKEDIPEVNVQALENKEGAATWSKDAKHKDEKQEIEHKVASVDDWSKIPTVEEKLPEAKSDVSEEEKTGEEEPLDEKKEGVMFANVDTNKSDIKEVKTEVLAVPEPMPATLPAPEAVIMPAPTESVIASNVDTSVSSESAVPMDQSIPSLNSEVKTNANDLTSETPVNSNEVSSEPVSTSEPITEPVNTESIWS